MPVTVKDIARKAGVSHSTVSRALHGSTLIAPETIERIQQIAGEMGYSPSAAARALKTNRSQVLVNRRVARVLLDGRGRSRVSL